MFNTGSVLLFDQLDRIPGHFLFLWSAEAQCLLVCFTLRNLVNWWQWTASCRLLGLTAVNCSQIYLFCSKSGSKYVLELFWGLYWASWQRLGRFFKALGRLLAALGGLLGALGRLLGASKLILDPCWKPGSRNLDQRSRNWKNFGVHSSSLWEPTFIFARYLFDHTCC